MDAVRSYFFPPNAGTQTEIQTETQTGQNGMQTQTPGAAQPGTQTQDPGTAQPDGRPQTQGTAQPNFQTQVPGEGQPNAQAQTEKGQPLSPEKRIADLATDIKKSGLTTGKATIAAQEMVTEAEKRFGANSAAVLDAYQPGQNPRQFLNGFQNAYIAGTLGNPAALGNSKAATYLTEEQRNVAYELGQSDTLQQEKIDILPPDAKIEESELLIRKSLGAKAKNFYVELPNGEKVSLTEGTRVTNIQTIAGKGRNRQIDEIDNLLERYGGSALEWEKKKGLGYVDYQGESFYAELHWYEEPTVGKHKWKVKPDADGNWFIYED